LFDVNEVTISTNKKDITVFTNYGIKFFEICDYQEMLRVKELSIKYNNMLKKDFEETVASQKLYSELEEINWETLKNVEKLLSSNKIQGEQFSQIIIIKAKSMSDFIQYTKNNEIEELIQYTIKGERGLSLKIVPGDEGTDYEPYITKYTIEVVNIDWKKVLYPIRTKINCTVQSLLMLCLLLQKCMMCKIGHVNLKAIMTYILLRQN